MTARVPQGLKHHTLDYILCEDRIGTGPPRAKTEVMYLDLEYWAISGSIHPKGDPASWVPKRSSYIAVIKTPSHASSLSRKEKKIK